MLGRVLGLCFGFEKQIEAQGAALQLGNRTGCPGSHKPTPLPVPVPLELNKEVDTDSNFFEDGKKNEFIYRDLAAFIEWQPHTFSLFVLAVTSL